MYTIKLAFLLAYFCISNLHAIPIKRTTESHLPNDVQELSSSNEKLIFAQVIFRHGDRNANRFYPNDPHQDESEWPGGIGQLTNEGKRQEYQLGAYFRRRYNKVLGIGYSTNKVYVRSTDLDRTIASALANLAGLFKPTDNEIWSEDFPNWQPIPVHSIDIDSDYVVHYPKNCPKFDLIAAKYRNGLQELNDIFTKNTKYLSFLSQRSGWNITTVDRAYQLNDILNVEKQHNKTLPRWAANAIKPNGVLGNIAQLSYRLDTDTPELARIRSGFLIKEMLQHFSQKIDSTLDPDRSLWLYSAHDFTISNFLNSLKLFDAHFPPYAASVHFELYKSSQNEHYLQLFYRKSGEEILVPMEIPNCGTKCTLNQFYATFKDIIPGNYEEECRLP